MSSGCCLKSFQSFSPREASIGFALDGVVACAVCIRTGAASSFCFTWMSDPGGVFIYSTN